MKSMDTINIELNIEKKIDVDIDVRDILYAINDSNMKNRWNYIAIILNGVKLSIDDLTDEQKTIITKYLEDKLQILKP